MRANERRWGGPFSRHARGLGAAGPQLLRLTHSLLSLAWKNKNRAFNKQRQFMGVVGGDRRIPSYGGEYRYAREDKDVDVRLLLFESFGGFGKGVGEILWGAANLLQNKLTRAQYLDEVTWTTKSWLGLQKQRISCLAVLAGVA
ncbi:Hypothetical protein EMIHUDRAFT_231629 [Emiliania huxleyi CCMP1516]|uniref:Uncharacterized protein n=2 Tax=Emiliania huxleyi TaxID=2903 RepID=A0A0D3K7B2_EMIH1|nr:Hypothetical protein EMIHUDRAFT_231629 [Emiliania huxleyi CCMP1516]EOD31647.1 Hypothetical protein EMIHUDRAFT_231629 [Emiliania huxleyi CCMP1516]|eukprot:XP_005784076.1 Hypothetical protein EMIHUDRAFT_231629 [Emiliania huxleyi CCMP1516]